MPTLYLSASRAGVAAALIKHHGDRAAELEVLTFTVTAQRIADLRDVAAMSRLGVDPKDAAGDWQREIADRIDDERRVVVVLDIRGRADAYRT